MTGEERPNAYGFWPTDSQRWLLRAALGQDEDARSAFEAWQSAIDFERLDAGSFRLLPLLYQNLVDRHIPIDPGLRDRLRGVYRQTWYKNQLLVAVVSDVLTRFSRAGIRTLVLKGVPLGLAYYPGLGVRPMWDADILVPTEASGQTLEVALAAGFVPRCHEVWPPRLFASTTFAHRDGWEIDLHTNVMHECRGPNADADLWAAAVPLTVGAAPTLTLAPEDQVLHIVAHGVLRNAVSPVRWVADATMVIRRHTPFDWLRLWHQARARRMSLVVGHALRYLRDEFGVDVPAGVLARFDGTPIGLAERFEYRSRLTAGAAGLVAGRVADFLRARPRDPDWQGPLGFVRYVRDAWGLTSSWRVPVAVGQKTASSMKEWIAARSARDEAIPR